MRRDTRPALDRHQLTALMGLTRRQRQVLAALHGGRSRSEAAAALGLAEETLKHYMIGIRRRIGATPTTDLAEVAEQARRAGLITPDLPGGDA